MSSWDEFLAHNENQQAQFLLDVAYDAHKQVTGFDEIRSKVEAYLKLGYTVLNGDNSKFTMLIVFLEDPKMENDFGSFFEQIKQDKIAVAALDLASYACGFVCRLASRKMGYKPLPDTVVEAVPEVYEYFMDQANFLKSVQ